MDNKNLIKLILVLILVLAIPVAIYLVRQQTVLKSRATPEDQIQFFNNATPPQPLSGNPPVTNNQNIKVKLNYIAPTAVPTASQPSPTTTEANCRLIGERTIGLNDTKLYFPIPLGNTPISCVGGVCSWSLLRESPYFQATLSHDSSINLTPSNVSGVLPGTYRLQFVQSSVPRLVCTTDITIQ